MRHETPACVRVLDLRSARRRARARRLAGLARSAARRLSLYFLIVAGVYVPDVFAREAGEPD